MTGPRQPSLKRICGGSSSQTKWWRQCDALATLAQLPRLACCRAELSIQLPHRGFVVRVDRRHGQLSERALSLIARRSAHEPGDQPERCPSDQSEHDELERQDGDADQRAEDPKRGRQHKDRERNRDYEPEHDLQKRPEHFHWYSSNS